MSMSSLASALRATSGWVKEARCRDKDPGGFFYEPPDGQDRYESPEKALEAAKRREEAKDFCKGCPVRGDCLEYALSANESFGVWGGKDADERRRLKRDRRARAKLREDAARAVAQQRAAGYVIRGGSRPLIRQEMNW